MDKPLPAIQNEFDEAIANIAKINKRLEANDERVRELLAELHQLNVEMKVNATFLQGRLEAMRAQGVA